MSDAVEEVKRRVDLVEHIGKVVRLQKSGRNFRGLCPFHTEKTPSFYVFPDRASWRCFGSCGDGGDLFSFVQKRENVDFRGALRMLADEAGVQLTAESAAKRSRTDHLAAIMSAAVDYYQRCFREASGEAAREYVFTKRRLSEAAVDAFRIGWAPDEWRALRDYLGGRGYEERDVLAAGLLVEPENGGPPYDRFRGRVIIPIADERGQYVAMGGRGLHGEEPKYLNSPQTELFDKGRTLFGLHLASAEIRKSGVAVVVEGYMDVMGPWQAGFRNVVATMGTSLTEAHAAMLRRFTQKVVLAMDPDAAGMAAAERAGALFMGFDTPEAAARSAHSARSLTEAGDLDLRVAPLPPGKDPDEVAHDDPEGWQRAVEQAAPYPEFLLMRLMGQQAGDSPIEARKMVDRLRPVLQSVPDAVERAVYVQRVARHLGITEQAVWERIRQGQRGPGRKENEPAGALQRPTPEEWLLSVFVQRPALHSLFGALPEHLFARALDREVYRRWAHGEDTSELDTSDPVAAHWRRLAAMRVPALTEDQAQTMAKEKIALISRDSLLMHYAALTERLAETEKSVGASEMADLAADVWRGVMPSPEQRELAETLIESQQLGISIHRREATGGRAL